MQAATNDTYGACLSLTCWLCVQAALPRGASITHASVAPSPATHGVNCLQAMEEGGPSSDRTQLPEGEGVPQVGVCVCVRRAGWLCARGRLGAACLPLVRAPCIACAGSHVPLCARSRCQLRTTTASSVAKGLRLACIRPSRIVMTGAGAFWLRICMACQHRPSLRSPRPPPPGSVSQQWCCCMQLCAAAKPADSLRMMMLPWQGAAILRRNSKGPLPCCCREIPPSPPARACAHARYARTCNQGGGPAAGMQDHRGQLFGA